MIQPPPEDNEVTAWNGCLILAFLALVGFGAALYLMIGDPVPLP